ncbi:uncharacterized protein I206_104548 [Kwoniella pini CBS 10737]|uniref:Vps72/YL1 C-terminal domain-containing protein n=1 Tax=Kwoniella pini CBS 10737 TaxID=1296096 RepID=A0A1B9I748_9TREE|nr:uncharacterized protein I206_02081 [Kwoniella pini CBS 10737]OCF51367.1 hypothetical protein I206_02081 [Kwoniella pini CBS 10737]
MSNNETVTTGRAKRTTAGNRMRELLEKAHQDDDDEIFKEVEDDEEFSAPQDVRDVFLEEFADTDEEVEEDEEAEERAVRREERQKAKGKGRAIYDPLSSLNKNRFKSKSDPTAKLLSDPNISLLDPTIDVNSMAPSTLVLALRKKRREVKRENRSEARRSNLRASTLKTEEEIRLREENEKFNKGKKGRRAQHETGEIRGLRPMTQFELIEAALEEEERNKEALRDWLKKEDEKRELRKISRKRVRGPRLTWVSRTVGKLVEIVGEEEVVNEVSNQSETGITKKVEKGVPLVEEEKKDDEKDASAKDVTNGDVEVVEPREDTTEMNKEDLKSTDRGNAEKVETVPATPAASIPEITASNVLPVSPQLTVDTTDLQPNEPVPDAQDLTNEVTPVQHTEPQQPDNTISLTDNAQPKDTPMPTDTSHPESASQPGDLSTTKPNESFPSLPAGSTIVAGAPDPSRTIDRSVEVEAEPAPKALDVGTDSKVVSEPASAMQPVTQTSDESQYMRNYLILSQIPGGLTEEIKLILGDHVEWDKVMYVPGRNRPLNRKKPICPFTGLPAKYRHPTTMIPYANSEGYKHIEGLLHNRYKYDEGGWWLGGEEDMHAEGMEAVEGWWEASNGGWLAGKEIPEPEEEPVEEVIEDEPVEEPVEEDTLKGKRKRGKTSQSETPVPVKKRGRGRPSLQKTVDTSIDSPRIKGKSKKK